MAGPIHDISNGSNSEPGGPVDCWRCSVCRFPEGDFPLSPVYICRDARMAALVNSFRGPDFLCGLCALQVFAWRAHGAAIYMAGQRLPGAAGKNATRDSVIVETGRREFISPSCFVDLRYCW